MPREAFAHVDTWIFDLDNTLYHHSCRLFDQIDDRISGFIKKALSVGDAEAEVMRRRYWREHGTTLHGLMTEHGVDPNGYLEEVHDIDVSHMPKAPELGAAITALPGRKIVHTNGSRGHAERVLAQLGVLEAFEALYGVEHADLIPKPKPEAYHRIWAEAGVTPGAAAMFEDTARNLETPHAHGVRTVWLPTDDAHAAQGSDGEHVHFVAEDLTAFLRKLV